MRLEKYLNDIADKNQRIHPRIVPSILLTIDMSNDSLAYFYALIGVLIHHPEEINLTLMMSKGHSGAKTAHMIYLIDYLRYYNFLGRNIKINCIQGYGSEPSKALTTYPEEIQVGVEVMKCKDGQSIGEQLITKRKLARLLIAEPHTFIICPHKAARELAELDDGKQFNKAHISILPSFNAEEQHVLHPKFYLRDTLALYPLKIKRSTLRSNQYEEIEQVDRSISIYEGSRENVNPSLNLARRQLLSAESTPLPQQVEHIIQQSLSQEPYGQFKVSDIEPQSAKGQVDINIASVNPPLDEARQLFSAESTPSPRRLYSADVEPQSANAPSAENVMSLDVLLSGMNKSYNLSLSIFGTNKSTKEKEITEAYNLFAAAILEPRVDEEVKPLLLNLIKACAKQRNKLSTLFGNTYSSKTNSIDSLARAMRASTKISMYKKLLSSEDDIRDPLFIIQDIIDGINNKDHQNRISCFNF